MCFRNVRSISNIPKILCDKERPLGCSITTSENYWKICVILYSSNYKNLYTKSITVISTPNNQYLPLPTIWYVRGCRGCYQQWPLDVRLNPWNKDTHLLPSNEGVKINRQDRKLPYSFSYLSLIESQSSEFHQIVQPLMRKRTLALALISK